MNYTTTHETWYKAFISLISYLKNNGIDLKDIIIRFGLLPKEDQKGLSEANLKRYKQDIKGTRVDGLIKLVNQIEASFELQLIYEDGLPKLTEYNDVIIANSKLESVSSQQRYPNYQQFNCYYLRSDRKVGMATLRLDLEKESAFFTLYYKRDEKIRSGKMELSGKCKVQRSISEGKLEIFLSVNLERNDSVRKVTIPTTLLFYVKNHSIDKIQSMTGTYTSFSRILGDSVAGLIVAKRSDLSTESQAVKPISLGEGPLLEASSTFKDIYWIGNYLHEKRIIAENIYDTELESYLKSNAFVDSYSAFVGRYVGYYIRTSGVTPTLEKFYLEMHADGTAKMEAADSPTYYLYFRKVDTRLVIGYLESEKMEGEGDFTLRKEKFGRWDTYNRVMFAFHHVEGINQIVLYGIYGGIEHSSRSPISGRIVLRRLSDKEKDKMNSGPQSIALDENFYKTKENIFSESKELRINIEMYLHGKVLQQYTDYIGAEKLAANLPTFLIGEFLCFSIFTEEDNDNLFKIGKYPLKITYPNTVVLQGRSLEYTGQASFRNNFLVLDLASTIENDLIRMAFRVRGSQWDHIYGVSLGRRGVNPESRAEVLIKMSEHFLIENESYHKVYKYHESYFFEQQEVVERMETKSYLISMAKLLAQDIRFPNVISFLRGEYNRYICSPYSVPDYEYDYDTRVKSERRSPFYAACFLFSKMGIRPGGNISEEEIECINYLKKANFHGFALNQNFGDKNRFDEKKLRSIKQFELEIKEEKDELADFRLLLTERDYQRIKEWVDMLWYNKS